MSFSEEELKHDIETMTAEDFEAKYSGVDLEEGMAKRENKLKKNIATTKLGIQKNNFGNPELEKAFARSGSDEGRAYVKGKLQQGRKLLRKEEVELEEKAKPSAGLTAAEKSAVVKKAKAGEDIGKKGKGFEDVAAKAAKQYGSKERGEKVAAAAMWKNIHHKEEVELDEEREPSPIAGTRLVSKHMGKGGHHAEVRRDNDIGEYQVHHYQDGKHMGEGPVSYHGSDKEGKQDATDTANYEVKNYRPKGGHLQKVSEAKEPWMGRDLEKPAYQRKAEYEKAKKEGQGGGPALRTAKNEEVEQVDELSKKAYGDYINRASASKSDVAHEIGKINQVAKTIGTTPKDREDRNALNKVHANRSKGIGRAVKNLTKGGIEFEEECASCEEKKLSPKQMKIAKLAGDPNKIDAEDFKKLRKEETQRITPDTLISRNKAVERSIMEIMATNRDLRQEAKIAAFEKNAKSQEKE